MNHIVHTAKVKVTPKEEYWWEPVYLFHIPYPYFYTCDDCGARHFSCWGKKGIFKYKEIRHKRKVGDLDNFLSKAMQKNYAASFEKSFFEDSVFISKLKAKK